MITSQDVRHTQEIFGLVDIFGQGRLLSIASYVGLMKVPIAGLKAAQTMGGYMRLRQMQRGFGVNLDGPLQQRVGVFREGFARISEEQHETSMQRANHVSEHVLVICVYTPVYYRTKTTKITVS